MLDSSRVQGQSQDALSPAAFAPVVKGFASARQLAVRHLAARALAPLVPPNELRSTLEGLLASIPAAPPITNHNQVRQCSHVLQGSRPLPNGSSALHAEYGKHAHSFSLLWASGTCNYVHMR